jgi:transglutaminase superfamily protein
VGVKVAGALVVWAALSALAFGQGSKGQGPDYQRGDWHLQEGRGKRLVAELRGTIKAPQVKAREWILYAARAPDHELSMVRRQFMWAELGRARRNAKSVSEGGGQEVFLLQGATLPAEEKQISFRVRYEITTSTLSLKPGRAKSKPYLPRRSEVNRYLASNDTYKLRHPDFKAWLERTGLIRKAKERDLAFAWRVIQVVGERFTYQYPPKSLERACDQVVEDKASDCGGLSALAVAALRANRIPARTLIGRWVEPNKDSEPQAHVKYEFFAEGIGWVPCDGSGAVQWKGGPKAAFGKSRGKFLVMHYDYGSLRLDSVHWGQKQVRILQGVRWWVSGSGKTEGSSTQTQWIVRLAK